MRNQLTRYCHVFLLALIMQSVSLKVTGNVDKQQTVRASKRTNILYLYVDDMGWGSIGPNGQAQREKEGKPFVLTPNLNKLAATGVNFRRSYGCTVCSPARSSQQTGFHQGYTFADRNDPNNAKKAIRQEDITMGDVLSKAGYVTGYWGKWGYGGSKDKNNPVIENVQTLPTSHGYQHVVAELHHVRAHTFFQPTLWTAPSNAKGGLELKPNSMKPYTGKTYPNYPASQDKPSYPEVAYCDDVYAFACLEFVRQQSLNYNKTGQPFFGLFAAQIPHAPFGEVAELPDWDQNYKDKPYFKKLAWQSKQWCAMVTRIDAHFGNILNALEDPNGDGDTSDSVADNTLVIFQSDNGGPGNSCRSELDANGGLSGSKSSIMEGGIRVPTIMRWGAYITAKSKLKAGSHSDMVIDCTDLLPTFCDVAGAPTPVGLSGVSLAPMLTGQGTQRHRDYLIHEAGPHVSIIRGKYKLVRSRVFDKAAKSKKKKSKKIASKDGLRLYDLEADHGEKNNIANEHPELVKELNVLLTGERVDEPVGFANTYHNWLGIKGSSISEAKNWSSYVYQNAGTTYMNVEGAPTAAWSAKISNGVAVQVNKDVDFLGLEIGGGLSSQQLTINSGITLTGRNEVRVSDKGTLILNNGTVASLRWLDVQAGGVLKGFGNIKGSLYSQGTLVLTSDKTLNVTAAAELSGRLDVLGVDRMKKGQKAIVLKAEAVRGRFSNTEITADGQHFIIGYTPKTVTITKQ